MDRRTVLQTAGAVAAASLFPVGASAVEPEKSKLIAMVAYQGFTALDLIGPFQVLSMVPGYETRIVAKNRDLITTDSGLTLQPSMTFEECPEKVAVLFAPGGTMATVRAMSDPNLLAFLKSRGATAEYVTSVCTGSLVLGAAGLLRGYRATTHWSSRDVLKTLGATPVAERVVIDRNRLTGGGVTAGIDFGLVLASRLASEPIAQGIQLGLEYDPAPPFKSGSPETAPSQVTERSRKRLGPFLEAAQQAAKAAAAKW
jgi:cyclohexyl-isocyanide hydratase